MEELPFLLRLIDDPSANVRERVGARLRSLGPGIWREIEERGLFVDEMQRAILEGMLHARGDELLQNTWADLQSERNERRYLERALLAICDWQNGAGSGAEGKNRLDVLAHEFMEWDGAHDATALANFLFEVRGLGGASPDDYYNPLNSNVVHTLEAGVGLPITLACVFILVGARVGLSIEGCNFPGHFLARDRQEDTVFDPYNGGRVLSKREVATLLKAAPQEMRGAASAREIVARVLRNLSVAYHQGGEAPKSGLMLSLLRAIDGD